MFQQNRGMDIHLNKKFRTDNIHQYIVYNLLFSFNIIDMGMCSSNTSFVNL